MNETLKRCKPLKIYQLTKAGHSYEIYIDRVDSKGRLYPYNSQRGIPADKIITDKSNQKFWSGSRYFTDENLMNEIIHEEVQAEIAALPSNEEVTKFWKEFKRRNPDV